MCKTKTYKDPGRVQTLFHTTLFFSPSSVSICPTQCLHFVSLPQDLFPGTTFCAVISLDTLGEEDTESMMMLEPTEDQGADDGHSMVIIGPQGPPGQESPTAQTPKRSPPSYHTQGGLRKRRRGASSQPKQLPNKPQDLQVSYDT